MATCSTCGRELIRAGKNEEITGDGGAVFEWREYDVCPICEYHCMDVHGGSIDRVHPRYMRAREEALRRMTPGELDRLYKAAKKR